MKFNKDTEYAILSVLYLCRSGRSNSKVMAKNLNIAPGYLEIINRRLAERGVLKRTALYSDPLKPETLFTKITKWYEYEVLEDPTVLDIVKIFMPEQFLKDIALMRLRTGEIEHRALMYVTQTVNLPIHTALKTKIRDAGKRLVEYEVKVLNSIKETDRVN